MKKRFCGLSPEAWRIWPYYAMSIGFSVPYVMYWGNFLTGLGFDEGQIGTMNAIAPLVAMAFQPLLGMLGDRIRYKNHLALLLLVLASVPIMLLGLSSAWIYVFVMMLLYSICTGGLGSINEAMAMEVVDRTNSSYGPLRMGGAVMYMVLSPLCGLILANEYGRTPYLLLGFMALCVVFALFAPKVEGHAKKSDKVNPIEVLKDPVVRTMTLLGMGIFMIGCATMNFGSLFAVREYGATSSLLGWMAAFGCAFEVMFFFLFDRVYYKLGATKMMLLGGLCCAVRLILQGFFPGIPTHMISSAIGPIASALYTQSLYRLVSYVTPMKLKASAMSMLSLTTGVARAIGSWTCGRLLLTLSYRATWILYGVGTAVLVGGFALFFLFKKELRQKIYAASALARSEESAA